MHRHQHLHRHALHRIGHFREIVGGRPSGSPGTRLDGWFGFQRSAQMYLRRTSMQTVPGASRAWSYSMFKNGVFRDQQGADSRSRRGPGAFADDSDIDHRPLIAVQVGDFGTAAVRPWAKSWWESRGSGAGRRRRRPDGPARPDGRWPAARSAAWRFSSAKLRSLAGIGDQFARPASG